MNIGQHVSKNNRRMHIAISESISEARKLNIETRCCQIFAIGPQKYHENLSKDEIDGIIELTANTAPLPLSLYIHTSYLSNPWGVKPEFGIHLVKRELEICDEVGGKGVVVHLAQKSPKEISDMLPRLLTNATRSILYLEMECYKSHDTLTYETSAKIARLFGIIREDHPELYNRVGLCIDTAHIWAAGVDISSRTLTELYLKHIKEIAPASILIHLNDQTWAKGSGRDKHAPLMYGTIWSDYHPTKGTKPYKDSGLCAILEFIQSNDICAILERKPDEPKINNLPVLDNITSDYMTLDFIKAPAAP